MPPSYWLIAQCKCSHLGLSHENDGPCVECDCEKWVEWPWPMSPLPRKDKEVPDATA